MPIFSIIIPIFNSEQYLGKCIESVLNQTFSGFELILVNDGSTDKSLAICEQYALNDLRIKVLDQNNQGVSAARNNGIKSAKGEYITFIDSDDFVDLDYLETFSKILSKKRYDFIVSGVRHVYEYNSKKHEYLSIKDYAVSQDEIARLILVMESNSLLGGPVAKCFSREIINNQQLIFDERFQFGEDQIFNLEFLKLIDSIYVSNYVGYNYLQKKSDSLVKRKYSYEKTKEFAESITKLRYSVLHKYNVDNDYINRIEKQKTFFTISAILSTYSKEFSKTKKERIEILKIEIPNINVNLLPNSRYYNCLKFIFERKSLLLVDIHLMFLTRLNKVKELIRS